MTTPGMPGTRTAQLLADLEIALDWMVALGVAVDADRLRAYRTIAHKWDEFAAGRGKLGIPELAPILATFGYEVPALIAVYRAFHALPREALANLIPQLSQAVGRPIRIDNDRNLASDPARDILFKLLTGAYVHRIESESRTSPGPGPHSSFIHARRHIYVECKRLGEVGGIGAGLNEAAGYLVDTFNMRPGTGKRGLIALDASKFTKPSGHVLQAAQEGHIEAAADGLLLTFIDIHGRAIQDALRAMDRRIIGVMVFSSTVGIVDAGQSFINLGRWSMLQRQHINISDLEFLGQFAQLSPAA